MSRTLIAHIVYRLDVGGLEMVVVNLINRLPPERFGHVVICLTECADHFRQRITRSDVTFHALHKQEGKDWKVWFRMWRLLRRLKPGIVHTCNIATMEAVIPAALAGVPVAIHAEHGRDVVDLDGSNWKYLALRRLLSGFVDFFVPVSQDLEQWLRKKVRVPESKIRLIVNGIDLTVHPPREDQRLPLPNEGFSTPDCFIIGTVGRLWPVKDHANLLRAFSHLSGRMAHGKKMLRLVFIGDGPLREDLENLAVELGVSDQVWITGWRDDVPQLMRGLDLFVLSSLAEGTPLTILEAMAAGLPVVATRVGGVADLVVERETGQLAAPNDPEALAWAMAGYLLDPSSARVHGAEGRRRAEALFGLDRMVASYQELFLEAIKGRSTLLYNSLFDFFSKKR